MSEARLTILDVIFGDGEEGERPALERLFHLRRHGACTGMGLDAFFPDRGRSALPAKEVCWGCPVRAECLRYAIEERIWWGVWAGLTEKERRVPNALHAEGVPIEEIVAKTLAGDLDQAMASRRTPARIAVQQYGWRADGEKIVVDEAEQQVLVRLEAWANDGMPPARSAAHLNAEGVTTRGGKKWSPTMIGRLLRQNGWAPQTSAADERRAS
jgi:WhiB family transcriptional regulator, redox-sensing transcriptional regulator